MKQFSVAASLALLAAFWPGSASAVTTNFHYHKWVVSGGKEVLGMRSDLDLDCHVLALTPPVVLTAPQHGTLSYTPARDFPKFNVGNPHYKCSFKKVAGLRIVYRSTPGFHGTDQFKFQENSADGDINVSTFDMTVQ